MQTSRRLLAIISLTIFTVLSAPAARADEKPVMKAVVAHEYGTPEVLKFENIPRPEPKEDEALVRVIASGVNPADPLTLSGKYAREFGTHLPLIPGYDIAGLVEKTGAKITKLKVGDAVYGYPDFGGGWAEYVTVKEWEVAAKPKRHRAEERRDQAGENERERKPEDEEAHQHRAPHLVECAREDVLQHPRSGPEHRDDDQPRHEDGGAAAQWIQVEGRRHRPLRHRADRLHGQLHQAVTRKL